MVLAYKGLCKIYCFFTSIKNDIKDLTTFCFPPSPPSCVVGEYAEKGRHGSLPVFGARDAPVTCIPLLDIVFKEQIFCWLNKFMGKPFPAAAPSVSEWPCKCWSCEGRFSQFSVPFLNLGVWTMEGLGCKFVMAATGVKSGLLLVTQEKGHGLWRPLIRGWSYIPLCIFLLGEKQKALPRLVLCME